MIELTSAHVAIVAAVQIITFVLKEQRITSTTTLRQRVIQMSDSHMRKYLRQLIETLTRWRTAQQTERK